MKKIKEKCYAVILWLGYVALIIWVTFFANVLFRIVGDVAFLAIIPALILAAAMPMAGRIIFNIWDGRDYFYGSDKWGV